MAPESTTSIDSLLSKLTASLDSANAAIPEAASVLVPEKGISLLDVKSELLLSYLQNLVFLILVKLKNAQEAVKDDENGVISDEEDGEDENEVINGASNGTAKQADDFNISDTVVKRLVELRVYLEKGVRPLENRLKYQIDKVLRAADTSARDAAQVKKPKTSKPAKPVKGANGVAPTGSESDEAQGGGGNSSEDDDSDANSSASEIDELAYRPNPAAFARQSNTASASKPARLASTSGVYRPPHITPSAPPTTPFSDKPARAKKLERSRTIDEYVNTELSTVPLAEPSIGSTIVSGGRRVKTAREREDEAERRAYEESNFIRLPKEGRAETKRKEGGRKAREVFGGEEMRGLGEGVERIARLTAKRRGVGGGGDGDAERRRGGKRRKVGGW